MLIEYLTQTFEDEVALSSIREVGVVPDVIEKSNKKVIVPLKFRKDIEALEEYIESSLTSGLYIEVSLHELLAICPRDRKKSDAYLGLKKFLSDEMGVILTIKKTNKNERN